MTQYINLLNPALRPRREWLSLGTLAIALGAVLLVLAAAHLLVKGRADEAQRQASLAEAALQADQAKLVASAGALAAAKPDPRLAAELESLRLALHAREGALEELASGSLGDTSGFSEQFRAFARQASPGLWLTGFTLAGAGSEILIQGRALKAEQVPAYIQRLKDEPVFRGKSFASLQIEEGRSEEKPGAAASRATAPAPFVEFRMMSSLEMAKGPGRAFPERVAGARP